MDKSKILTIVASVLGLIGVFFLVRIIMAGDDAIKTSADLQSSIVSPMISFSKFLLIATAIIAIGLSLFQLVKQPAALKKSLISLVVLAVLFAIAYFASSDVIPLNASGDPIAIKGSGDKILTGEAAKSVAKWVGTLITFTAILGVVGIGTIAFGFVKSFVK